MEDESEAQSEGMSMRSMSFEDTPRIENVVGTARKFLDDFIMGLEAESICGAMGVSTDKTFLLEGKPGTGKTLAGTALNNELNREFYLKRELYEHQISRGQTPAKLDISEVGALVFEYSVGRHGSKYINEGSKIMQIYFDTILKCANKGVITIASLDEVDAIAGSRTNGVQSHSEDRKILETLMKNLQILHDTPNAYAILMTNKPGDCDEAVLRAKRIDKRYHFELPKPEERLIGFQHAVLSANKRAGYKVARGIKYKELVEITDGFNYADIAQSVDATIKKRAMEVAVDKTQKIIPAAYVTHNRLKAGVLGHKSEFHKEKKSKEIGFLQ
ncbi:ATP-binding protein [archaeon]|jgi:SpoVK/Ycf46/Vps4 family AAA+-type ATPase|nr:ATP-binding protein [archaeon]